MSGNLRWVTIEREWIFDSVVKLDLNYGKIFKSVPSTKLVYLDCVRGRKGDVKDRESLKEDKYVRKENEEKEAEPSN